MIAETIWEGDVLIADLEELEKLDASEIYPRRINAKEVLISQKGDEFRFPFADGTAQLLGRDHEVRESILRQYDSVGSEDLRGEFQGNSDGSQPAEIKDDTKARNDFLSIEGDFISRHHVESGVHLQVPKEESFPVPLKYRGVALLRRATFSSFRTTKFFFTMLLFARVWGVFFLACQ